MNAVILGICHCLGDGDAVSILCNGKSKRAALAFASCHCAGSVNETQSSGFHQRFGSNGVFKPFLERRFVELTKNDGIVNLNPFAPCYITADYLRIGHVMGKIDGTVLLLEDEPFIALALEELLGELGAPEVVTLATCQSALEWLQDNDALFAVVDPKLKDGYCGRVVRHLSDRGVPFVVHSGDLDGAGMQDRSFERGIWLPKPSPPAQRGRDVCEPRTLP